jgi:hypothetical protein
MNSACKWGDALPPMCCETCTSSFAACTYASRTQLYLQRLTILVLSLPADSSMYVLHPWLGPDTSAALRT